MILLAGNNRIILWPYLLLIAVIHLIQDRIKINLTNKNNRQTVLYFFLDQIIHVATIIGVLFFIELIHGPLDSPGKPTLVILALVAVFLTQFWFITERIIYAEDIDYVKYINQTKYSRMITRIAFTGLLSVVSFWILPAIGLFGFAPYPQSSHRNRAVLIDLLVSVGGFLAIILILR
jgi:hydrogenase-4 membrane subunit HyfE